MGTNGQYYRMFVYGTLKRGEPNHIFLEKPADDRSVRFVGLGKTVNKYPLVIASKYNIPFLLSVEGVGSNIHGEVYLVDDTVLLQLDELECHPTFYTRREEPIEMITTDSNGHTVTTREMCWTYFLNEHRPQLLALRHFENYTSEGDHSLPYVKGYARQIKNYNYRSDVSLSWECVTRFSETATSVDEIFED